VTVGGEADLPQRGQIYKTFPDLEVPGVIDGDLSATGLRLAGRAGHITAPGSGQIPPGDPAAQAAVCTIELRPGRMLSVVTSRAHAIQHCVIDLEFRDVTKNPSRRAHNL
jgi:hypothetical protein